MCENFLRALVSGIRRWLSLFCISSCWNYTDPIKDEIGSSHWSTKSSSCPITLCNRFLSIFTSVLRGLLQCQRARYWKMGVKDSLHVSFCEVFVPTDGYITNLKFTWTVERCARRHLYDSWFIDLRFIFCVSCEWKTVLLERWFDSHPHYHGYHGRKEATCYTSLRYVVPCNSMKNMRPEIGASKSK